MNLLLKRIKELEAENKSLTARIDELNQEIQRVDNREADLVSKLPSESAVEKVIRKFKKTYFEGVRGEVTYCVDGVIAKPLAKAIHNRITGVEK